MAAAGPGSKRRDAARNREAILAAARELFAGSADVAMYEVARKAGVGQATLYRNFLHRDSLVAALAAEPVEALERVGADHSGDPVGLFVLLRALADSASRFHGVLDCVREPPATGGALEPLQQ